MSRSERISSTESVPVPREGKGESGRAIVIGDSLVRGINGWDMGVGPGWDCGRCRLDGPKGLSLHCRVL